MLGNTELLIIFGVALLLFGPSKLPQLGGAIGASIRNFRKGMKEKDEHSEPVKMTETLPQHTQTLQHDTDIKLKKVSSQL